MSKFRRPVKKGKRTHAQLIVQLISVYRWGQSRDTEPLCFIAKFRANEWWQSGAGRIIHYHGTSFLLNRPQYDGVKLRSSLGASLTNSCLDGSLPARAAAIKILPGTECIPGMYCQWPKRPAKEVKIDYDPYEPEFNQVEVAA